MKLNLIKDNKEVFETAINRVLDMFLDELEAKGVNYKEINEESDQLLQDYKSTIIRYEGIRYNVVKDIPLDNVQLNQLILIVGSVANLMDKQVRKLSFTSKKLRELSKDLAKK